MNHGETNIFDICYLLRFHLRDARNILCIYGLAHNRQRAGRPQTSSSPPVIFVAGRPKAALLFWFFGDFRCGALLFMVISRYI